MADKDSKKKKSGFSLALIILVILLIFIFFLLKREAIMTNLKKTDFFGKVFGSNPEFIENHVPSEKLEKIPLEKEGEATITIKVESENKNTDAVEKEEAPGVVQEEKKPEQTVVKTDEIKEEKPKPVETVSTTTKITYTELQLCFVEIDAEGSVNRKIIKRSIPKNDSPLTTAIKLLLEGPDTTLSAEKNCMTLIPPASLRSASVKNGVAYLDFSDSFEFNSNGVEGYQAQLMQVVYTATTFSTVDSVQILIEGKKQEYLGPEGIWIGSPLSRNSF